MYQIFVCKCYQPQSVLPLNFDGLLMKDSSTPLCSHTNYEELMWTTTDLGLLEVIMRISYKKNMKIVISFNTFGKQLTSRLSTPIAKILIFCCRTLLIKQVCFFFLQTQYENKGFLPMLQEAVDELFQHTLAQSVMMGRLETFN